MNHNRGRANKSTSKVDSSYPPHSRRTSEPPHQALLFLRNQTFKAVFESPYAGRISLH